MNRSITTVFVIFFALVSWIKCDICDICVCIKNECDVSNNSENSSNCSNQYEEHFVCDGNEKNQQNIDLNTIQWPNKQINASVTFNNFKLSYLTNALCSASTPKVIPSLTVINLDSNSIKQTVSNPFEHCTNLTSLSIANNLIDRLPSEFFESTLSLQRLNISHNALSEFNGGILSHCKQITKLDLSHNEITILKVNEILDASPNIETINAANNLLFAISDNNQNKYLQLERLNLSGNKMTVITKNTFISYPSLQNLDISANILGNIEHNAFEDLVELRDLDLSSNHLKDLSLKLPDSVEHVSLARNQLKYWPTNYIPKNLQKLDLQENEIEEIFSIAILNKHKIEFSSLKYFNISKNHINSLPATLNFPVLEVLDASYNEFTSIPQYLGSQASNLKELKLRGNPIKNIEFTTKMSAHKFDFSELKMLTEFDASVFNSIEPNSNCVELTISHNPSLKMIKNSFERVPNLCRLDLSYNNFRFIDHNWMNWSALDRGVDLQGNPIDCTCNSQWMLDYFVPMLYANRENHRYLMELRCATPERVRGHRLVRYLNHSDVFCNPELSQAQFGPYQQIHLDDNDDYELLWYQGLGLWLTISLVIIIILSSISLIVILVRRSHNSKQRRIRSNNRRFNNGGVI